MAKSGVQYNPAGFAPGNVAKLGVSATGVARDAHMTADAPTSAPKLFCGAGLIEFGGFAHQ